MTLPRQAGEGLGGIGFASHRNPKHHKGLLELCEETQRTKPQQGAEGEESPKGQRVGRDEPLCRFILVFVSSWGWAHPGAVMATAARV